MDIADTVGLTGWAFFEPAVLPPDFALSSRLVERDPPAPGVTASTYTVIHDYRFRDSPNIPGILMTQSRPLGETGATVRPQSAECGGLEDSASGPFYYAEGLIRVLPSPEGDVWLVCKDEAAGHPDTHAVVMTRAGILIEILAFPESGVSREEMLEFVGSLAPVADSRAAE